jgi:PAS domain S-box-containing protein
MARRRFQPTVVSNQQLEVLFPRLRELMKAYWQISGIGMILIDSVRSNTVEEIFLGAPKQFNYDAQRTVIDWVWRKQRPALIETGLSGNRFGSFANFLKQSNIKRYWCIPVYTKSRRFGVFTAWSKHRLNKLDPAALRIVAAEIAELLNMNEVVRREISRRKKVETLLRQTEERYAQIADMQTEMVCRYLPSTTLTFVNGAFCRYFEKKREDLIGASFLKVLPWHEDFLKNIHRLCKERETIVSEHQIIGSNGDVTWQQWENRVLLNHDETVFELQAVGRDITQRKDIEETLRRKQDELSGILQNYEKLTPREREVMSMVVEGQLNKEIAAKTGVTERTIKFHRHQIMERMQAGSLAELVRMAERLDSLNSIADQNSIVFDATFVA